MKQTIKYYLLLLFSPAISSCSTHHIRINENGTAYVEISILEEGMTDLDSTNVDYSDEDLEALDAQLTEFYSSEIISNYQYDPTDGTAGTIRFDIASVDSLGSYLDPLFGSSYEFRLTAERLIMIGSEGKSDQEDDFTGMTNMFSIHAIIVFEKEIRKLITVNDYVKQLDNYTIEIKTSVGEMNYNGIGNRIEIIFK